MACHNHKILPSCPFSTIPPLASIPTSAPLPTRATPPLTCSLVEQSIPFTMTRRQPTLLDLPPELLTRIASWLSLCEYSHLARTCPILYGYLFHPSEVVHFLKTRYRLSIESGSLIIFAYLANIQIRAPRLLEKVFDEFFATNLALSEQSQKEQGLTTSRQNKGHLKSLCEKALDTRLTLIADPDQSAMQDTRESSKILTTEYGPCQEMQDVKTRQRAKRDAVRMLGVLYALDKTHIGPSSSTNALVLSGATDITEVSAARAKSPAQGQTSGSTSATKNMLRPAPNPESTRRSLSSVPSLFSPPAPSMSCLTPGFDQGRQETLLSGKQETKAIPHFYKIMSLPPSFPLQDISTNQFLHPQSQLPPVLGHGWDLSGNKLFGLCVNGHSRHHHRHHRHHRPHCSCPHYHHCQRGQRRRHTSECFVKGFSNPVKSPESELMTFLIETVPSSLSLSSTPLSSELYHGSRSIHASDKEETCLSNPSNGVVRRRSLGSGARNGSLHKNECALTLHEISRGSQKDDQSLVCGQDLGQHQHQDRVFHPKCDSDHDNQISISRNAKQRRKRSESSRESVRGRWQLGTEDKPGLLYRCRETSKEGHECPLQLASNMTVTSATGDHFPIPARGGGALSLDDSRRPGSATALIVDGCTFGHALERTAQTCVMVKNSSEGRATSKGRSDNSIKDRDHETEVARTSRVQQVLNREDKIAFLTKYTDRMHLKLRELGIKDWSQEDIQRKKTYQLMIQHNDKTGEKDLVQFYLRRFGGSIPQPEQA